MANRLRNVHTAKKTTSTIYKIKSVKLSANSYTYNGKVKNPTVTVKDSKGNVLKNNTDYTVKHSSGRKALSSYSVKVTFKGKYSGSKTLKFDIKLGKVSNFKKTKTIVFNGYGGVKCSYTVT